MALGGIAVSLSVAVLLIGFWSRTGTPDLPSPNLHPPDEIQAIYWNAWASAKADPFSPSRRFPTDSDCEVFLDLSGFDYSSWNSAASSKETGPEFVRRLRDWLTSSKSRTVKITVLFLPDRRYFDSPEKAGVTAMEVDLDEVRAAFNGPRPPPSNPFQATKDNLGRVSTDSLFGRARLALHTRKLRGATSIGISIWDGIRPVDELTIPICIGSESDCKVMPPPIEASLKGLDSLRLADQRSTDRSTYPDGALHFLELNTGTVIGVFHRKDWRDDQFQSWRLQDNAKTLREWLKDKLIPALNLAANQDELTERGRDLFDRLFPDDVEGEAARRDFQQFFVDFRLSARGGIPGSIFVRMLPQDEDPLPLLPIGLMAVQLAGHQPEFLGFQFRVETPLQSQDYRPVQTCVSNWVMLVPPEDSELRDVRNRLNVHLQRWQKTRTVFDDIPKFREWARETDRGSQSTILATLSHHDRDRLYFSSQSIMSTGIHREFANPSMAILGGCGTGNIGATDIVQSLNRHGVAAVVATSTQISPMLGADFLSTLDDVLGAARSASVPLELVMFDTLKTLATKSASETSGPYGPLVLTYALLGNGSLQICTIPK